MTSDRIQFKKRIHECAIDIINKRINSSRSAMTDAQDAANSEEKSSAGDKYETSRAMGQLDRDMNAKQLEEAKRDLALINSLTVTSLHSDVSNGAVVICKDLLFFIALGLGRTTITGYT